LQLVKKFPAFHGTRRFITTLTSVRHLSLSWASPIQSIYPHPTSWRSILIFSSHLRLGLPSHLFPSGFSIKTLYTPSSHPYAPHAQPISVGIQLHVETYCTARWTVVAFDCACCTFKVSFVTEPTQRGRSTSKLSASVSGENLELNWFTNIWRTGKYVERKIKIVRKT